jgi:stress-induced morphogen
MLVEAQTKANFGQHTSKRGLADHKRIAPQVVAVQFDQVEGVQKHAIVSAVMTDEIERGDAVVIASDSFAIDDA